MDCAITWQISELQIRMQTVHKSEVQLFHENNDKTYALFVKNWGYISDIWFLLIQDTNLIC